MNLFSATLLLFSLEMPKIQLKKDEEIWMRLQSKVFEKKIAEIFCMFREERIEPILIKGWAAAQFYPEVWQRICTDIDICVNPSNFEKAEELSKSEKGKGLFIDLHKGFRTLDKVSWDKLFSNSRLIQNEGQSIRVLAPEDHLRILCVHWLIDGGEDKNKLFDIYYLVKNREADFDWQRCLESSGPIRKRWIICTIGLTSKFLGLDLADTPIEKEASNLPPWLVKAVEKEWKLNVRLIPLRRSLFDRKQAIPQILKRFPPNAIQSTVNLEGDFDKGYRIFYQIGDFIIRSRGFASDMFLKFRLLFKNNKNV